MNTENDKTINTEENNQSSENDKITKHKNPFLLELRSVAVAFSMYSKIPMPEFKWNSADMKYHLIYFPLVGIVIGLMELLLIIIAPYLKMGSTLFSCIAMAIPFLITGGFHFDGFMDTCDALNSYQSREKKLEILKDPHIGAFAVISAITYVLLVFGFVTAIKSWAGLACICFAFPISRCLSGLSVINWKKAKSEGMVSISSQNTNRIPVTVSLILELLTCIAGIIWIDWKYGLAVIIAQAVIYFYYYIMSKTQFGGITGDLAGYFVTMAEGGSVIAVSILSMIMGYFS